MKTVSVIGLLLLGMGFSVCAQSAVDVPHLGVSLKVWRHHIRQNPERSFEEYGTSRYVADRLLSLGNIEVSHPPGTSVPGMLRGGRPGLMVAFRADMDALPVDKRTDFAFSSQTPGESHACGHDMHTARLLGAAKVLGSMREQLPGTVCFLFQHADEEAPGGAQEIIASGALEGVDAIFGVHILSGYPIGSIGILPAGAASTAADGFMLTIRGKGSHGPALRNDARLRELVGKAAIEAVGREKVFDAPCLSASEEFSYYADVAPAYLFNVGAGDGPANHNLGFHADDAAMIDGVKTEVQVIRGYLNSGAERQRPPRPDLRGSSNRADGCRQRQKAV